MKALVRKNYTKNTEETRLRARLPLRYKFGGQAETDFALHFRLRIHFGTKDTKAQVFSALFAYSSCSSCYVSIQQVSVL